MKERKKEEGKFVLARSLEYSFGGVTKKKHTQPNSSDAIIKSGKDDGDGGGVSCISIAWIHNHNQSTITSITTHKFKTRKYLHLLCYLFLLCKELFVYLFFFLNSFWCLENVERCDVIFKWRMTCMSEKSNKDLSVRSCVTSVVFSRAEITYRHAERQGK